MNFFASFKAAVAGISTKAKAFVDMLTGRRTPEQLTEDISQATMSSLAEAVTRILIPVMQEYLRENKSMFRGDLAESFVVVDTGPTSVELQSTTDYAHFVEQGSAPRGISDEELDNLVEWAAFKHPTSPSPESIALAVASAIEAGGNNPHPYAAPALAETQDAIFNEVARQFSVTLGLGNV